MNQVGKLKKKRKEKKWLTGLSNVSKKSYFRLEPLANIFCHKMRN